VFQIKFDLPTARKKRGKEPGLRKYTPLGSYLILNCDLNDYLINYDEELKIIV
jgi:hypothetical protein